MDGKNASKVFSSTFIGEYVEIICKTPDTTTKLQVTGFLLDHDADYYYIGQNPIEVHAAVKKEIVEIIYISEETDSATEMLHEMEIPDNAN